MHSRGRQSILSAALATASLLAQEGPPATDAFLARDSHQEVTIAARPIPDLPEAEQVFGKKVAPVRAGVLPVELLVVNDRAERIHINLERIKVLSDGEQFAQADTETVALLLYPLPGAKQPDLGPKPVPPIPLPRKPGVPKDKKHAEREEAEAALRSRQLRVSIVPPGGSARGFLYFNLGAASLDLAKAQVYIPEVTDLGSSEGLIFFEIALSPYAKP